MTNGFLCLKAQFKNLAHLSLSWLTAWVALLSRNGLQALAYPLELLCLSHRQIQIAPPSLPRQKAFLPCRNRHFTSPVSWSQAQTTLMLRLLMLKIALLLGAAVSFSWATLAALTPAVALVFGTKVMRSCNNYAANITVKGAAAYGLRWTSRKRAAVPTTLDRRGRL